MLTKAQSDLLTRTGPGTPGGRLMRSYWQPIAASQEMPLRGAPLPIRILSEDLVLFRDDKDRLGLIQRSCPTVAPTISPSASITVTIVNTDCE